MSDADYVAKLNRRLALRAKVEQYWLDEPARAAPGADASLKKHTTLFNRLRSSLGPADALIKDIDGVTLSKYQEETVAAVVEGVLKLKSDYEAAVEIIVHLHTRLTPHFLPALIHQLLGVVRAATTGGAAKDERDKEKEDKERLGRQRPTMRVLAELAILHGWADGVVKGVGEVLTFLKAWMSNDPQFSNTPLLSTFLKSYGRVYLGSDRSSAAAHHDPDEDPSPTSVDELVPPVQQTVAQEAFKKYFDSTSKTLIKAQTKLLEQDKRNHEAYIKSGEIFEDRQQAYERMTKAVERLTAGVQTLAELLGLQPPILPTAATLFKSGLQIVESSSTFTVRDDGPIPGGIWDDEEEKRFYEDLVDLKQVVPPYLLGLKEEVEAKVEVGAPNQADGIVHDHEEAQRLDEEDIRRQLEEIDLTDEGTAEAVDMSRASSKGSASGPILDTSIEEVSGKPTDDGIVEPVEDIPAGPAARLTALMSALPEAVNREMIDKLATEFASLNSKGARNRIVRFLAAVDKQRTDLLPHYARFIATLNPYMPDIGQGVVDMLEEEMRYLQRKRMVRELDSVRLKNVRFFGELAKFKVTKPFAILHVLKVFLDEFRYNVENIANLLETCGRFLLRYEDTAVTAKNMVELMRRKQANMHLDQRHSVMLENAFYQCNPPERVVREVVEQPPMQSFITHLLHDVLSKRTFDKVLKLVRKLHWDDAEVYQYLLDSFTNVWEVKYGNIVQMAAVVYEVQRYHPAFAIDLVDQVLEDIRIGMEENIFKHNQRRIASIKSLGELYMHRVLNATIIFDTLWMLISFGHPQGLPVPGRDSPIDAVDDFFRIRLVCTLLDTCGTTFSKGGQKKRLDQFLMIFQLYIVCKNEVPMDVDFMLNDTFEAIRPKEQRLKLFPEVAVAVDDLLASQALSSGGVEEDGDDDVASEAGSARVEAEVEEDEAEQFEAGTIDDGAEEDEDDDDSIVLRERRQDPADLSAQADFDRDFARALAETTDARRADRKAPIFDQAVPRIKRATDPGEEGKMQFHLVSKRGGKPQVRAVEIPIDSTIALNTRSQQLASEAEKEQLKRLVLQNERRQEQSETSNFERDMRNRGIRVRYGGS